MLPLSHTGVPRHSAWPSRWTIPAVLGAGFAVLYVPTYWGLFQTAWASAEQGHGPLIMALCVWLAAQRWPQFAALPDRPAVGLGGGLMLLSLAAYVIGRSQGVQGCEAGSQIGVLAALTLWFKGVAGLRVMVLPLGFMLFAVPLPNIVVQTLTMPLKIAVSSCAEWLLHQAGYPVGRTGVMLIIGQYRLLVADACAGLNSMFTLEALGFLWMSLRPRSTPMRDAMLAVVILPISFTANVIRVMALVLITYHLGDAAGQGFAHSFSGIVLFVAAVLMMMAAEAVIRRPGRPAEQGPPLRQEAA
ncbi:MAG TPA: exosortase B [Rhizobacter sp.]|nr:exosortase B [Rhizobacter sp.]